MKRSLRQSNFTYSAHLGAILTQSCYYLLLGLLAGLLAACAQATPATPGAVYRAETVVLPTGAPTPKPTPVSTRVISDAVLTPGPSPTTTPIPDQVRALVVKAMDGDTLSVVMEGDPPGRTYTVRYLGIDAPPNTPSVPWGIVAFEQNEKLTKGKVVRLERDQSDTDNEGNLLRYVYLGDSLLSVTLAEQGLVRAAVTEPDTRFKAEILAAEAQAKSGQLGLWGNRPPTPTPRPVISSTLTITTTAAPFQTTTPATGSTAAPVATTVFTPESTTFPTVEPETTATVEPTTEPKATAATVEPTTKPPIATSEPTGEPTSGSESEGDGLQGPQ